MVEFDMQDLLLPEINLMKYVNQKVMYKFLPKNVQRMIEALTTKGEYFLDWIILRRVEQNEPAQVTVQNIPSVLEKSVPQEVSPKDTTKEEEILKNF